ncbi:Uncharacterised protein [uncultured archaeon]|nr:Uncharacterised protein [uncultured archaeon]
MKAKKEVLLFGLLFLLLGVFIINAADEPSMPSIPVIGGLMNSNESSSLPETFEKFQQVANNLSEEESRKAYLQQEWTKILAENPVLGPVLYYTEGFFSITDPFWELVLKQKFSWSWLFILSLGMWIMLIFIFYSTAEPFTQANFWINIVIAFCIACLVGLSGGIKEGVSLLISPLQNIWTVLLVIFISFCIIIIYKGLMKNLKKGMEEKGKKDRSEIREMKENTHEKIIDTKLKAEGL